MNINDKLITDFRETVNSNSGFVFEIYHSQGGKNLWNIICSCMDWISVAIKSLSNNTLLHEDIDVRVMQFFSIISSIDIVFESVIQLHRTIFKNNKIPFAGKRRIFTDNKLDLDDNNYFKEIRAMFGAHPVNLTHKNNQKWYASWPYDHFKSENSTFELRLYSNQIGIADITLGVNIIDLESFLIERYEYLTNLKNEIIGQYNHYRENLSAIEIKTEGEPLDIIKILESESKERLNNEYYKGIIYELKRIFSITLKEDHLLEEEAIYKKKLELLINELKQNLQLMKYVDLSFDRILNPEYSYADIGYSISKLYNYDFDRNKEPLFDYHMKELDKYSDYRYGFIESSDPEIVFLKLKLMLYNQHGKNAS